jgi:hypothetical protein
MSNLTEHDRLLQASSKETPSQGPAWKAYCDYLQNEHVCVRLLREAKADEETYIWYAEQDCEVKGYQWYQASQYKYALLVTYTIGILFGFSIADIDKQIAAASEILES